MSLEFPAGQQIDRPPSITAAGSSPRTDQIERSGGAFMRSWNVLVTAFAPQPPGGHRLPRVQSVATTPSAAVGPEPTAGRTEFGDSAVALLPFSRRNGRFGPRYSCIFGPANPGWLDVLAGHRSVSVGPEPARVPGLELPKTARRILRLIAQNLKLSVARPRSVVTLVEAVTGPLSALGPSSSTWRYSAPMLHCGVSAY
jgi:hypothetical protein